MKKKSAVAIFAAGVGIFGAVPISAGGLFSATGTVIAVAAENVYVGEAEGHLDGTGTVTIHSQKNPAIKCVGDFTSSVEKGGSGLLKCNDNTAAAFQFKRLTVYRGYGVANFSWGDMSFAYGFTPEEAAPYLNLPSSKRLARRGTEIALIDR
jgi:hypothetical protein